MWVDGNCVGSQSPAMAIALVRLARQVVLRCCGKHSPLHSHLGVEMLTQETVYTPAPGHLSCLVMSLTLVAPHPTPPHQVSTVAADCCLKLVETRTVFPHPSTLASSLWSDASKTLVKAFPKFDALNGNRLITTSGAAHLGHTNVRHCMRICTCAMVI